MRSPLVALPLVVVGLVAASLVAGCGDTSPSASPGGGEAWDLSRLPDAGVPLRESKTRGGVVVKVLAEGTGAEAQRGDLVDLRVVGRTLDGLAFDEGVMPGVVIGTARPDAPRGLDEGIAGIKVGEKRRLQIPGTLGYGAGTPPGVKPGDRVVLDVERIPLLVVEVLDLQAAAGPEARIGQEVTVHYKGTLKKDGSTFDSSYDRGQPATFRLARGSLIEGWIRGIPGMRVGGKRRLVIPADLAYGKEARGAKIPPNSDLVFEVELLNVK